MKILKITGTLPLPSEPGKCLDNPFVVVLPTIDHSFVRVELQCFADEESAIARHRIIATFQDEIYYVVPVGTSKADNTQIEFDRLDIVNQVEMVDAKEQPVKVVYGVKDGERTEVQHGDEVLYDIQWINLMPTIGEGKNIMENILVHIQKIIIGRFELQYSERLSISIIDTDKTEEAK